MQLNDTLISLMRRWYLVLMGLALTCGLGWMAYTTVTPRYESVGSILLMPSEATVGDDGNPYLYLGGMNDALDVLIRRTNSDEVKDRVLGEHEGASYVVERDANTQSPIVVVTADAAGDRQSIAVLNDALAALNANMSEMQNELSIPQERRITLRDLVIDEEATKDTKTAIQLAIVVVGSGTVGTLLLTGLVDGYLLRRLQRRARRQDVAEPESASPTSVSATSFDNGVSVQQTADNTDDGLKHRVASHMTGADAREQPETADDLTTGMSDPAESHPAGKPHGVLETQRR